MAESVVLSTCNRSEIYVASEDPARARDDSSRSSVTITTCRRRPSSAPVRTGEQRRGRASVSRGGGARFARRRRAADSRPGEGCVPVGDQETVCRPGPGHVFQWSFGVGKRVRTETALGEGAVSVSFAAVALARKIFGRLQGRRVLVVGAGEISSLTAQHLRAQGVGDIVITSRTHAHAETLAAEVGGMAVPWEGMIAALGYAEIVITATGSPRPIITRAQLEAVQGRRARSDPLFIIDVAVPRDVDSAVGDIEQVFLYNIDDLHSIVAGEPLAPRRGGRARRVASSTRRSRRFMAWQRSRGAVPTVVALRQRFESIRRSELQRLEGKLAGLSPDARDSRRRGHAPHCRKTAPRADRTAQGASRRRDTGRLHGSGQSSVPASQDDRRVTPSRSGRSRRPT